MKVVSYMKIVSPRINETHDAEKVTDAKVVREEEVKIPRVFCLLVRLDEKAAGPHEHENGHPAEAAAALRSRGPHPIVNRGREGPKRCDSEDDQIIHPHEREHLEPEGHAMLHVQIAEET